MSAHTGSHSFDWQQVNHRLANFMLSEVSEEMGKVIREEEKQIQFDNRLNQNAFTIPILCLEMQLNRADEWAQRIYDVYCDVWRRQGNSLSPQFLRAVCANGIRTLISARTVSVIANLGLVAWRTNRYPTEWLKAATGEFRRSMERLLAKWERKAEIDAMTLEHLQPAICDDPAARGWQMQVNQAKDKIRHFEAMIAAVDTKIAAFQQSLSAAIVQGNSVFKPRDITKGIERLHAERKELEFKRDDWQLMARTALQHCEERANRDIPIQLRVALNGLETSTPEDAKVVETESTQLPVSATKVTLFDPSEDYRHLLFNGTSYSLTRKQAQIVKLLHEAAKSGHPDVGKDRILGAVESETSSLKSIFKNSPLWQTLVVSCSRGTYRLDISPETETLS